MSFSLLAKKSSNNKTALYALGVFEGANLSPKLKEPSLKSVFQAAKNANRFSGKSSELFSSFSPDYSTASEILLVGLGSKKGYSEKSARNALGKLIQKARLLKMTTLQVDLDSLVGGKVNLELITKLLAELEVLTAYQFDRYKSKEKSKYKLTIEGVIDGRVLASLEKAAKNAQAIAEGILKARNLVNEPANVMDPSQMVKEAKTIAKQKGLSCTVLEEAQLKQKKMNGILGVNQGSYKKPALIILESGKKYKSKGTICFVGKGVTFDTGGLSIKPPKGMEKMKYDMAGSAAVLGAMMALGDLNLPVHIVALTPVVENNVCKDPQRPGDIIKMYNGKTVEVLNTDAEGRLILADALSYAETYKPKVILDLATLTGMCAYTFADQCIAIMGNDAKAIDKVKKASDVSSERCWELPMWKEYGDQLKSAHADLQNIGGTFGGTITAAKFLENFVPDKTPWVHLDIAGTAWCDSPKYDCPKGGTGVGVRLLTHFAFQWAGKK